MKTPAIFVTPSFFSITFLEEGYPILIQSTDKRYDNCISLYEKKDYLSLYELLVVDKSIEKISNGDFTIYESEIYYKGELVHNIMVSRILDAIAKNIPYETLLNFFRNILECESKTVVNELYLFLESNESMPIMEDGSFLAYRVVDENYNSKHSNPDGTKNRNKIGDIVTINRKNVDTNRFNTCSEGLHFCSYSYIPKYGYENKDRVMIVKIFPQDVVSIPNDYNNSKGRCCKYEVISEVKNYNDTKEFEDNATKQIVRVSKFSSEEINKVEKVLKTQIKENGFTTARKVSKSTKNPYIPVKKVIDIAKVLGFDVSIETTLSMSIIKTRE